jgi:hypothetical protein
MSIDIVLAKFQGGDSVDFDQALTDAALARYGVASGAEADRIETDDGWVDVYREHHEHNGTPYLLFNRPSGDLVWHAIFDVATAAGLSVLSPDLSAVCVLSTEVADDHTQHLGGWDEVFLVTSAPDLIDAVRGERSPYRPI